VAAVLLTLAAVGATGVSASAAGGGDGGAQAHAVAKKKKKKKAKKRRLCTVRRLVAGRLRVVYVPRYAYKRIRIDGQRRRVIVRRRVPLKAPCTKSCAVTRRGKIVFTRKKMKILVPARVNGELRLVRRKKRVKFPKLQACPRTRRGETVLGTPLTITLRDGSIGELDFSAFQRTTDLTGSVRGYILGRFDITKLTDDVNFTLTGGRIGFASTPVFIDDECNGEVTAAIRTNADSFAVVDTRRESTGVLEGGNGRIQSVVRLRLRVPLDLRNDDDGCNAPYITTGYTETPISVGLVGALDFSRGVIGINVHSGQQLLSDFTACVSPGNPTQPCRQFAIPFPFFLKTTVVGDLELGRYSRIQVP
jgi:hypothetical protein